MQSSGVVTALCAACIGQLVAGRACCKQPKKAMPTGMRSLQGNPSVSLQTAGAQPPHSPAARSSQSDPEVLMKHVKVCIQCCRGSVTWGKCHLGEARNTVKI